MKDALMPNSNGNTPNEKHLTTETEQSPGQYVFQNKIEEEYHNLINELWKNNNLLPSFNVLSKDLHLGT